jgi:hypothetical protein
MENEEMKQNKKILEQQIDSLKKNANNNSNTDNENINKRISYLEYIIYSIIKKLIDMKKNDIFDFRSFARDIEENTDISNLEGEYLEIRNRYYNRAVNILIKDNMIENLSKIDISMVIELLQSEIKKES